MKKVLLMIALLLLMVGCEFPDSTKKNDNLSKVASPDEYVLPSFKFDADKEVEPITKLQISRTNELANALTFLKTIENYSSYFKGNSDYFIEKN